MQASVTEENASEAQSFVIIYFWLNMKKPQLFQFR